MNKREWAALVWLDFSSGCRSAPSRAGQLAGRARGRPVGPPAVPPANWEFGRYPGAALESPDVPDIVAMESYAGLARSGQEPPVTAPPTGSRPLLRALAR